MERFFALGIQNFPMSIKVDELREAEFIDEQENGFGLINRPEEDMVRTSLAFREDGLYLLDP